MAEKYFPFNAVEVEGQPDRVYGAEDWAAFFAQFIGNGIYPNPSSNLQVLSLNNNMVLTVKKGSAMINGYGYLSDEDIEVQINTANGSYNRKDIIVLALDLVERNILVKYKMGIASANPQEPELIRSSDVHELKLASVLVHSGVQGINQSDITDTRLNASVCGIVSNVVQTVDATTLFVQYMDWWQRSVVKWEQNEIEQQAQWQEQLDNQQAGYDQLKNTIEGWYNAVKTDIAALQTFDFDNIAELNGAKKTTLFLDNGNIREEITKIADNIAVAERFTTFESDGRIVIALKVFQEDGVQILKQSTTTTTFKEDGSIEEVVS